MNSVSDSMTPEEFVERFHKTYHLHDPEACLEFAHMYEKCNQIDENKRAAMFVCRLGRIFSAPEDESRKKRSSSLMRRLIKELDAGEMNCVERSLAVFSEIHFEGLKGGRRRTAAWTIGLGPKTKLKRRGIVLTNPTSVVFLSADAWCACFNAAVSFGWEPRGTRHREYEIDGSYWSGLYAPAYDQTVTCEDACALSMALYRLIEAVQSGEEMTEEQLRAVKELQCLDKEPFVAQELADYALNGWFEIGNEPWLRDGYRRFFGGQEDPHSHGE